VVDVRVGFDGDGKKGIVLKDVQQADDIGGGKLKVKGTKQAKRTNRHQGSDHETGREWRKKGRTATKRDPRTRRWKKTMDLMQRPS